MADPAAYDGRFSEPPYLTADEEADQRTAEITEQQREEIAELHDRIAVMRADMKEAEDWVRKHDAAKTIDLRDAPDWLIPF